MIDTIKGLLLLALIFALFATFIFLLTDGMINYLTLGEYDISTI